MQPRGIDFFVYNVSDIATSSDFYENTLGLTLKSWEGSGWVEVRGRQHANGAGTSPGC